MNKDNLQQVFSNYISKFEVLNNPENDETFKWEVIQRFQDDFDIDAEDFAEMLQQILKGSANLIDGANQQPLAGLVSFAKEEPETVRAMFRALYEDDNGDLTVRQAKIRDFIEASQELLDKYSPGSWRYVNDQRSVMTYLFLNDPEHNYLYKYTQATEFADCVGFYEDWGSGSGFKLDVYCRMCDELVEAMKENQALLDTNASRFSCSDRRLYPDPELHILAFDIIYCCTVYDLFRGISYEKPDAKAKKLLLEKKEKAAQLYAEVVAATEQAEALKEAKAFFSPLFAAGTALRHKTFGPGTVVSSDGEYVEIAFKEPIGTKKFILLPSIANGFLLLDDPAFAEKRTQYKAVMLRGSQIDSALEQANRKFAPYAEYLEA